jgi:hypothetical protein
LIPSYKKNAVEIYSFFIDSKKDFLQELVCGSIDTSSSYETNDWSPLLISCFGSGRVSNPSLLIPGFSTDQLFLQRYLLGHQAGESSGASTLRDTSSSSTSHQQVQARLPSQPLPLRPLHVDELSTMPAHDFHKVNHEIHLSQMNKEDLNELAIPLLGLSSQTMALQRKTELDVLRHGGIPKVLFSGNRQAQTANKIHATSQMVLHELVAPLKAVQHQAANVGNYHLHQMIGEHLSKIPLIRTPEQHHDHYYGRYLYNHIAGKPSKYIRKQGY